MNLDPVSLLIERIKGIGHPEFPFLHKTYSPDSRIPCTDFTPFIVERLRYHDLDSICKVMRGILASNPGLGIGPGIGAEWGDDLVKEVAKLNFNDYMTIDNPEAELELKALFIIVGKEGGGREFIIADIDKPIFFSSALACYFPKWKESMEVLRNRANCFIKEMAKDTQFWEEYPLFEEACWLIAPPQKSGFAELVRYLTVAARIHLFYFLLLYNGYGSLLKDTTYPMRSFGINSEETSEELISRKLCISTKEPLALLRVWSKNDLIAACNKAGADYRKSWNKEKLFDSLISISPSLIAEAIERDKVMIVNPIVREELSIWAEYSHNIQNAFKLLCFI